MSVTRRSLVPRTQLLARLNAGLSGRLTLVSAPAWFGKTTLVVDWSRQLAEAWRQLQAVMVLESPEIMHAAGVTASPTGYALTVADQEGPGCK